MNLESLTFKQIVNCVAMIKQLKEAGILEFDINTTTATLNYDEATRYLENQILELQKENKVLRMLMKKDLFETLEIEEIKLAEKIDYQSRNEKAIPMLKELNKKIKDILKIGIDIKEISDIEDTLKGKI